MQINFFFALIILVVLVSASFFPENYLTIVEKQGFLAYFKPTLELGPLKSCKVTISGVSYELDPTTLTPGQHTLPSGTKITRFSQKTCGVRVKNLDKSVNNKWVFDVIDDRGHTDTATLTVDVLISKLEPSVLNITAIVDDTLTKIRCPNSDGARYCNMYNRYGEQFPNTCEKLTTLTIDQNQWTCQVYDWGNMHSRDGTVYVDIEERRKDAIKEMYETDKYVVISCNVTISATQCLGEMPGKQKHLLIMDGLLTDHYSTYDTSITNGYCTVEIEKPLKPDDIGIWRILYNFGQNNNGNLGCVFEVGVNATNTTYDEPWPISSPDSETHPIKMKVMGNVATTTVISCEVPYEISYCYLHPPTTDISSSIQPENFQSTKYLGQCRFLVPNITSGQWVCGVNDQNSGGDKLTYYQVTVYKEPAQAAIENVIAKSGERAKLMCKTVMNQPMNYCRFRTPLGHIHGMSQSIRNTSGSRFHYYGAGLMAGECGIEIDSLQYLDFGNWNCTFQIATKEFTLSINLEPKILSLTTKWGLGLGLAVTVILGAGFVGHRYFARQWSYYTNADINN